MGQSPDFQVGNWIPCEERSTNVLENLTFWIFFIFFLTLQNHACLFQWLMSHSGFARLFGMLQNFFCSLIKLGKRAIGKSQTRSGKTLFPIKKKKSYCLFRPQCMTHPMLKPVLWLCRILILTLSFNYFVNQN